MRKKKGKVRKWKAWALVLKSGEICGTQDKHGCPRYFCDGVVVLPKMAYIMFEPSEFIRLTPVTITERKAR